MAQSICSTVHGDLGATLTCGGGGRGRGRPDRRSRRTTPTDLGTVHANLSTIHVSLSTVHVSLSTVHATLKLGSDLVALVSCF